MTTTSHPAISELTAGIELGHYDADLDTIAAAVDKRRRITTTAGLIPGARVSLKGISPKYMNGMTGEIVMAPSRSSKRFDVRLDEEFRKRASRFLDPFNHTIRVNADMVTLIGDTP